MKGSIKLYIKILGLFGALSIIPSSASAQSIKPYIDFCLPDPDFDFLIGQTIDIYVHVKVKSCSTNADTVAYGNLFYWYQTDTMADISATLFNSIDSDPNPEAVWVGGKIDTIPFYCDSNELRSSSTGPINVIIIWPAFVDGNAPMCDSGQYVLPVQVFPSVGLEDSYMMNYGSVAFPNPAIATQIVYLNSKYSKEIEKISIINSVGQLVNIKEFAVGEQSAGYVLATEYLPSGIYHIHIGYRDKKTEVVKFIKN